MEVALLGVGKTVLNCLLSGSKAAIAEDAELRQSLQLNAVFLTDELAAMKTFLRDADEERNPSKVPRTRVKHVQDLAYDVEDCLLVHAVHLQKPFGWRLARTVLERHRIAEEMKGLRARVEDMSHRNLRYHLADDASSKPASSSVNRQYDLVPLISRNDDQELRVIVVWGATGDPWRMTVVREAYDQLKRMRKVQCYAWVRIMHPFNPSEFLQCIVRQFYMSSLQQQAKTQEESTLGTQVQIKMEAMNHGDLVNEFNKHVTERTYLIVLSDLSNIEDWDWIKTYFPNNKKGSRIIVSTERREVASLFVVPERQVVEFEQSSVEGIIYASFEKGSQDGASSSSSVEITDNDFAYDKKFTRIETIYGFKELFIGREKEKSGIIKLVSDNSSHEFQVISIWGMGGLGKTTLVEQVYQSQEVCNMFEKRACVTVKRPFNQDELLNSLVTQLTNGNSEERRNQPSLRSILEGRTYLVVLDDLSSIAEWDAIYNVFPRTEARGRIIVTTRVKSIAKHCSMKEENMHQLEILGEKDARDLFTEKVFGKFTDLDKHYPELTEVAKMILKKCNGLPHAIVTIADFLSKQPKTPMEWRKLNDNIGFDELDMCPDLKALRASITKEFYGLPYHLKSCFMYMSIFPEDHKISRRRLVRRWVAEGYSREIRGKLAEETYDSYFMELIDRSIIMPCKNSFDSRKGIDSCQMHDLMRDVSISMSTEENLVFRLDEGCSSNTPEIVHHLMVSSNWTGDRVEFERAVDLARIRSLTVFGRWRSFYISKKMWLLRVLDLENTRGLVNHHLGHIGSLVHLKYISLRGCRKIYHIPRSWGNLLQLETLDIKGTSICRLPQAIIKLRKLQHLFGGHVRPLCVYPDGRIPCEKIKQLCLACCGPKCLKDAAGLDGNRNMHDVCTFWCHVIFPTLASRRQDPHGFVVPIGIAKLKNLRTLGLVNVAGGKAILREIRRLMQLRKLAVRGVNKKNYQELCSAVADLTCLESLSVESAPGSSLLGLLDDVSTPPSKLQSLKLGGELVKLPKWISMLQNLVKLVLRDTMLLEVDSTMKALGELPNLAILRLLGEMFNFEHGRVRVTFCREVPFRSLMVLQLGFSIPGLDAVEFKEGAVLKLELLRFDGSTGAPANLFSGLAILAGLKEFEQDSRNYTFEKDVQAQLAANPNKPIFKKLNRD